MEKRELYPDIIKGVAIILVVLGHCIQFGSAFSTNFLFFKSPIFIAIYSFHMPLFMLISGYFFYNSINKHSWKDNIKTRFTRLLIPLFTWNTIHQLILTLNLYLNTYPISWENHIKSYFINIWFLWALFWCSLVVLIINRFFRGNIWIYFILGCIFLLLPNAYHISLYVYMYPYFIIGYIWNKYKLFYKINSLCLSTKIIVVSILCILYMTLYINFKVEDYIYTSGTCIIDNTFSINYNQFKIDFFRYIIGIIGSAIILIAIKLLLKQLQHENIIVNSFSKIGRKTIGIYIIGGYIEEQLLPLLPNKTTYGYEIAILETFIIIVITYFITSIIEKYQFSKKFLLGT